MSGIAAADLGGNGDLLAQLGENLPALRIDGAFEVLNLRPFAMSCHIVSIGSLCASAVGTLSPFIQHHPEPQKKPIFGRRGLCGQGGEINR